MTEGFSVPLIFFFDLAGTVIFSVTGAVRAIKLQLDLLGVIVFACTVGLGGGILRDVIIGATPVAALQNEIYFISCISSGIIIFFISPLIIHHKKIIVVCDALGLGVFTALGAAKGDQYALGPVGILLCGMLSAVGGGILRDIMSREIPAVLVSDFYATASIIGGTVYLAMIAVEMPMSCIFFVVSGLVTLSRLLAVHYNIQLPKAGKKFE